MPEVTSISVSQMVNILWWAAILYTSACLVVAIVSKEHRHAIVFAGYGLIAIVVLYVTAIVLHVKGV